MKNQVHEPQIKPTTMKKIHRMNNQQRQKQKVTRKTILIFCAALLTCLTIGLTVFLHLTQVDITEASARFEILIPDQEFTNEKSIPAPVIIQQPAPNSTTVFTRRAKELPAKPVAVQ
jgi:hypothetical protein